ncbi:MAG: hypothetical protein AAGJ35_15590 [Myxococcota bacterium]
MSTSTASYKRTQSQNNIAHIYIHDDEYSWLPAQIVERLEDDFVLVQLTLPQNWKASTTIIPNSSIQPLEDNCEDIPEDVIRRTIDLEDYQGNELPLQNLNRNGLLQTSRDMAVAI